MKFVTKSDPYSDFDIPKTRLRLYLNNDFKETSNGNLRNLMQLYEDKCQKFVSFVGAGVSIPLGINDWHNLLVAMLEECDNSGKELPLWKKNYERCTLELFHKRKNFNTDYYPDLAEEIFEDYKNNKPATFFNDMISKSMDAKNTLCTSSLIKMVLSIENHITTNLDRAIENAYDFLKYMKNDMIMYCDCGKVANALEIELSMKYFSEVSTELDHNKNNIYYLHADLKSEDHPQYILKKSDYKKFYPGEDDSSMTIYKCISWFFENRNILFVGFSFADVFVKSLFKLISGEFANSQKRLKEKDSEDNIPEKQYSEVSHFMLIDQITAEALSNQFLKDGVEKIKKRMNNNELDIENYKKEMNELYENKKQLLLEELKDMGIAPIIYDSNQHVFVEKLFEELRTKKNKGLALLQS